MNSLPDLSAVLAIVSAYALVVALPGANFLIVSQISLTAPRSHALCSAIGVAGGAAVVSAGALAAGHALASMAALLWMLNICFILVLFYIGVGLLLRSRLSSSRPSTPVMSRSCCFRLGLITAATNPITAVFFLGLVGAPNCRSGDCTPVIGAIAVFAVALCWFGAVALVFSGQRSRTAHARIQPWLNAVLGSVFLVLAASVSIAMISDEQSDSLVLELEDEPASASVQR